jgi:selenocysteine-specific elongation factor
MIVATAGHIDHGKTVLVKALTGVDTDRLPEEKSRGISIDLGYAYHALENGEVLGFVDVPGHERFVRNMLAGVTGIDFALLVVAADDGPMPQTEEHLAILDLLGVAAGCIAITKCDRATPERVAEVEELCAILTDGTVLDGAPVFPVSAMTGDGMAPLRACLADAAAQSAARRSAGHFRLAVDRRFVVPGSGLVVTGAVFSGAVARDDQLVLSPAGAPVRVRGLHAQNRDADSGTVGQRCALNIAAQGLEKDDVVRGDWIVAAPIHAPAARFDARIRLLKSETKPLRHWTPAHLHLGAADIPARIAVLQGREVTPGESALVQIVLEHPTSVLRDDRLILRDQSARRTIAGGRVIDPFAPARGRGRPERLAALALMEEDDPATALAALMEGRADGIDLVRFALARNLAEMEAAAVFDVAEMMRVNAGGTETGLDPALWQGWTEQTLAALAAWHDAKPAEPGPPESTIRNGLSPRPSAAVFAALVDRLAARRKLVAANRLLALPDHQPGMNAADRKLWAMVEPLLAADPLHPPSVAEMAKTTGLAERALTGFLRRAAAMGHVAQVAPNRFIMADALRGLAETAAALAAENPDGFVAADFRTRGGIGRNLAIEVLEHFDARGLTRRRGDARTLAKQPSDVFGPAVEAEGTPNL